jgi:hypothetical protein
VFPKNLALQWGLLILLSGGAGLGVVAAGIGAGPLVGPILAAIFMGLMGSRAYVPNWAFLLAQGMTGCIIASMAEIGVVSDIAQHFWPMVGAVVMTLAGATFTGWALTVTGAMPGSTGAWGALPGAASAMVALAADFGGDPRMVAVMQYLRVLVVVLTATAVSHAVLMFNGMPAPVSAFLNRGHPTGDIVVVLQTVAIAAGGALIGKTFRVPAGAMLIPMLLGAALKLTGVMEIGVPRWMSMLTLATIGWSIGLKFRRDLMAPLLHALPAILGGIVTLLVFCAMSAWVLTQIAPVSMMTAYLATSPGGMDSVSALAMETQADMPFVVAFQTLRLFAVILIGPFVGRWLARVALDRVRRQPT